MSITYLPFSVCPIGDSGPLLTFLVGHPFIEFPWVSHNQEDTMVPPAHQSSPDVVVAFAQVEAPTPFPFGIPNPFTASPLSTLGSPPSEYFVPFVSMSFDLLSIAVHQVLGLMVHLGL